MTSIKGGITAGIVATFVIGAMMLVNNAIHRLPNPRAGEVLAAAMDIPTHPIIGWVAYILVGALLLGIVFAIVAARLPTPSYLVKGLLFGIACWLVMMVVVMPLGGAGFFGAHRGAAVAVISLGLNVVYGIVLGLVYRWTIGPELEAARASA